MRGGRAYETRGEDLGLENQTSGTLKGKDTYSCTSSGQGGIPIRHWEVLSDQKATGHTAPGAGGARVKG